MDKMKNNVPEIRFQGFDGEWEKAAYKDLFAKLSNNSLSRAELNYSSGSAKNVHYGDVLIKLFEILDIENEQLPYINNPDIVTKYISSKLQDGDVIIADAAEDETVGKCTELVNVKNETILAGLHTIAIRPEITFASLYLGYYLNTDRYHNQLLRLMQGTKVSSISNTALQDTNISFPSDKFEQTKIGRYFKNLDKLITLKQHKLDKLKNVKKSMLEKMFPRDGATVPEIRFQGFGGEWERKTLGKVSEISSAARVHKHQWKKSGVPFFRSSDVVAAYKDVENSKAFISFDLYKILSRKVGSVKKNDILITGGGSIGIPFLVNNDKPLYFKDADLLWLKKSEEINSHFLICYFSTINFRNYISSITHIGTISHYTIEQAKSTPVKIPKWEEQTKIGNYFKDLDHLISLQQKEIEKLKQIKSACLNKMFV